MADTAPEDVEKRALLAFLDAQRAIVLAIVAGWAEDALRTPVLPSGWTPLGLVKHPGFAGRHWFQRVAAGPASELPWAGLPGEEEGREPFTTGPNHPRRAMTTTGPGVRIGTMAMEFTFGARVGCSDGHCGELTRTIFDPAKRTVTHLVIEPRHHAASGRLVPIELVDAAGGEISLRCTLAEFDRLDPCEDVELVQGLGYVGGYGPDAVTGYGDVGSMGVGASASGMGIGAGLGHNTPTVTSENVPEGEGEVARHDHVHARDGLIGQLNGFVVDPGDYRVTHIVLREGHLWGRRDIAIPVSAVTSADPIIRLNITKKQVEELPPRN